MNLLFTALARFTENRATVKMNSERWRGEEAKIRRQFPAYQPQVGIKMNEE
jgi:hypothetical protein